MCPFLIKRTKKEIFLPKHMLHRERLTQADRSCPTACFYMISSAGNMGFTGTCCLWMVGLVQARSPVTTRILYHTPACLSRENETFFCKNIHRRGCIVLCIMTKTPQRTENYSLEASFFSSLISKRDSSKAGDAVSPSAVSVASSSAVSPSAVSSNAGKGSSSGIFLSL